MEIAMSKGPTTPIPVRLDKPTRDRLKRAAKRMGANTSTVIRFAVFNQLPQIESGTITLATDETAK
jgi:predicted DNA-binding protein